MKLPPMKPFRERNPIVVGTIGVLIMGLIGLAMFNVDDLPLVGGGTTYTAEFTEGAGLRSGDEVRVAGVKVGEVNDVELDGDHAQITFRVRDTWLGDRSTAAIKIKTLLGQKNLVLDPIGDTELDPGTPIPRERTTSPYDVTDVFGDLAETTGEINTDRLAKAFRTLSETLGHSAPQEVRNAMDGLSALSRTLASRDDELIKLFENTKELSKTLADRTGQVESLIKNGNVVLTELNARKEAIGKLFTGSRRLAEQLKGLVTDNQETLNPALQQLERVTTVLQRNQAKLEESLRLAGPYYRLLGNAVGNGRWIDTYICGLIPSGPPGSCLPPRSGGR
ncbi:MCE family protein [Amycolatopsis cihanbeyliensis]|uniref:Phospholipid/cholesterol/gamma-HCH transport system substrate-binding protein n=1 Tax=Amycolatopsis cihanbeyliensis TaxID=1128664 RepID=A0A542DR18_AMYCI|nr:MCE family protein [Amycolatopsis cihanbeyliensis]TQJ05548.1 phospholipid/cholesterol/gamma-HCH transport system substrate-binding protein [Amycolatopsis cihanbeyliensis]